MFISPLRFIFALISISTVLGSCGPAKETTLKSSYPGDGKYDGADDNISGIVKKLSPSVVKIDVIAFYKTWILDDDGLTPDDITDFGLIKAKSVVNETHTESVTGTSVVVFSDTLQVAMITCAHIVNFPDTVYQYYDKAKTRLKSVSLKQKQKIYESGRPGANLIKVVASDTKRDLAFIVRALKNTEAAPPVIPLVAGSTKKLDWGSEIYVLGYPMGNLMLTKGIASVDKSTERRFISDALFNRGISGSPVFALLDGGNDYEWIGIAGSAASQTLRYLEPDDENYPDSGNIVVKKKQFINYGITYSISIEEIITFIAENSMNIKNVGIDADLLNSILRTKTKN
ncbi:MAG: trypsin-like peptidase domain-containing protein [Chlorobi bacterium]|nr:trypsin-like peptidase domain-containing protein [Chlorobiota bacterium]